MDLPKILKAYGIDPKLAKNFKSAEPEDGQCREVRKAENASGTVTVSDYGDCVYLVCDSDCFSSRSLYENGDTESFTADLCHIPDADFAEGMQYVLENAYAA